MTIFSFLLLAAALPQIMAWESTPSERNADEQNWKVIHITFWTWGAIIVLLLVYRLVFDLLHYIRRMVNLDPNSKQRYFVYPNEGWAKIKSRLLLAPLFRRRHNQEFKLSAAANVGTLPSRVEAIVLIAYLLLNVAIAAIYIDWSDAETFYSDACNRAGVLATLNLLPLLILAGRTNPLIRLLDIPFNTYNLIHRWIGRIVVLEAFMHASFWAAGKVHTMGSSKGWHYIADSVSYEMIYTGLTGLSCAILILLQSPSIVRHAFYETFLHLHLLLVTAMIVAVWIHLEGFAAQTFLIVAVSFWIVDRSLRLWSFIRKNISNGVTKAEIETLPGDCLRVTIRVARPWQFRPGQHVYLSIPSIGLWTSHPFSLAWSHEAALMPNEKSPLPTSQQDIVQHTKTTSLSLLIRRRTGFTNVLYNKTSDSSTSGKLLKTAFIEGPYNCSSQTFTSYGTVLLFAAGVGISHQVSFVRSLVLAHAAGTAACQRVVLVWILRSVEHMEWIRPWMTEVLHLPGRRDVLRIRLYVTRPRSMNEIRSPSDTVQMFPGRPDVRALVAAEQKAQVGAMAVSVCGTGSLGDEVRLAVRQSCERSVVDFFEEAFTW